MLYGSIKVGELNPLMNFINHQQAAIVGGLGGGLLTGGAAYLSADKDKLKKGLLGALPGALAGGYVGNKYDSSVNRHPFITHKDSDISDKAWDNDQTWDPTSRAYDLNPEQKAWADEHANRHSWLWEKPYGIE